MFSLPTTNERARVKAEVKSRFNRKDLLFFELAIPIFLVFLPDGRRLMQEVVLAPDAPGVALFKAMTAVVVVLLIGSPLVYGLAALYRVDDDHEQHGELADDTVDILAHYVAGATRHPVYGLIFYYYVFY